MASQDTVPSAGATKVGTGGELPVLQQAVDILQRDPGVGVPAHGDEVDSTAGHDDDDDDDDDDNEGYTSDESDDSPPPSMSSSMLERGEGNKTKVGTVLAVKGSTTTKGNDPKGSGGAQGSNTKDSGKVTLVPVQKPIK